LLATAQYVSAQYGNTQYGYFSSVPDARHMPHAMSTRADPR
jgi:hypothetical protein